MKKINENKNNKKANSTVNKVFEEMKYAEEYTKRWNALWHEEYSEAYSIDLYFKDRKTVSEIEKRYRSAFNLDGVLSSDTKVTQPLKKVTLYDEAGNDYECEFGRIDWYGESSNKIPRRLSFRSSGDIIYTKGKNYIKPSNASINYSAKYNVNTNDLTLDMITKDDQIQAIFTDYSDHITYNNIEIEKTLITGIEKISIKREYQPNKLMIFEIIIDKNRKIISEAVLINAYENNNQINGTYEIRFSDNHLVKASFLSKEGKEVALEEQELLNIKDNILHSLCIYNIIPSADEEGLHNLIDSVKEKVFKTVKSIKGDIPLKGLSKRLDIMFARINSKSTLPEEKEEEKEVKKKKRTKKHK